MLYAFREFDVLATACHALRRVAYAALNVATTLEARAAARLVAAAQAKTRPRAWQRARAPDTARDALEARLGYRLYAGDRAANERVML